MTATAHSYRTDEHTLPSRTNIILPHHREKISLESQSEVSLIVLSTFDL
jgi:hypothetical protein